MTDLTTRQEEALQAVAKYWRQGRAPTTGELLQELNIVNVTGLGDLLRPLERKGFVSIQGGVRGRQRLIELTPQGRAQTGFGLPVLGAIPAGPLREAIQESAQWIEGAGALLRTQPGDFLLRVEGDSMSGAGILPGDYVQLRPGVAVRSGEIVAAQICEDEGERVEATLKHLDYVEGEATVRLRAANPLYPDREFSARCVTVAGVFRGLIRAGE
ncbi:MAG TPA: S24 family peptidase [Abditibacterium sp.]|jgi:repressor LexA